MILGIRPISERRRLTFNVSGTIFETYEETVDRYPHTLLGNQMHRKHFYCSTANEFFFNRSPTCFEAILFFYQSCGNLLCPMDVSVEVFEQECRFFEFLDCEINEMKRKAGILQEIEDAQNISQAFSGGENSSFREKICRIFDDPKSSRKAWVYCVFSLLMIKLLIVTAFIGTYKGYRSNYELHIIEVALNIWFLVELALRFVFTTDRIEFARSVMNWIDILSTLPYIVFLLLHVKGSDQMGIFKTVKFIRVISLLRLTKHSKLLQIVGLILKSTLPHVKLQMLSVSMMIFVAATFLHYAEYRTHGGFSSIVDGLWWATQTITSVGYGDIVPASLCGKLFASFFMLFAVIVYVPVFSIGTIFATIYQNNVKSDDSGRKISSEKDENGFKLSGRKLSRTTVGTSSAGVVSYCHGNTRRISIVDSNMVRKQSLVYYNGQTRKLSALPVPGNSRKVSTVHGLMASRKLSAVPLSSCNTRKSTITTYSPFR